MLKLSAKLKLALSLFLILLQSAYAIHFPTVIELQQDYQSISDGKKLPTDFFLAPQKDSKKSTHSKKAADIKSLHIEWKGNQPFSHRYEQREEFNPDIFANLVAVYGDGATWHEWDGGPNRAKTIKTFPGLEQQWILKGYGNEKGWLGSGLFQGKYFLIFQESAPSGLNAVTEALRLNSIAQIFGYLDTSSNWLHTKCEYNLHSKKNAKSQNVCFVAANDNHWKIQVSTTQSSTLDIWLSEGESNSLKEIRTALESIPDLGQSEYANDLSQMLLGESQNFLVKVSDRLPIVFNWPSWQLQNLKAGQVPAKVFSNWVQRTQAVGDSLPALRYLDKNKMQVNVDLFFNGKLHLWVRKD